MRGLKNLRFSFLLCVGCFFVGNASAFDWTVLLGDVAGKDRGVGLLLSDIEFRNKQKEDLGSEQNALKKRAQEAIKATGITLNGIEESIKQTYAKMKEASGSYEELLNKKNVVLADRKQNLASFQDNWKEVDGKIAKHIQLVKDIVEYLEVSAVDIGEAAVYSWKDLDETKGKLDQLLSEINSENSKKERIAKLRRAEKEEVNSLKKEIELKNTEKEKLSSELASLSEKEEGVVFVAELKAKADLLEQEVDYVREKIEIASFKIEDLGREERYQEDEIFLLKQKLSKLNEKLSKVQKKLIVDVADVEIAKGELEQEVKRALEEKNRIAKERDVRKIRRDGLEKTSKLLEKQLEAVRQAGEEKSVEGYVLSFRILVLKNEKLIIEKELELLETRKEYYEINVQLKHLKARIIEVLHVLGMSKDKIDEWLVDFRSKERAAEYAKKVFQDKQNEINATISTINQERETLLAKQKEVDGERDKIFKRRGKEYFEVLANIKRAANALANQKHIVERHFSQISDLLPRQEELGSRYNFIIKYLEAQRAVGITKRSTRAISPEQLLQALYEVESFFKGLFWDTPVYLSPIALIGSVQQVNLPDVLGILLYILLFSFLFIGLKLLFALLLKRIKEGRSLFVKRFPNVFSAGIQNLLEFFLHHFTASFTLFFIYIHVAFGVSYFKPLTISYVIALFYLFSIPVLIYLGHRFVVRFRRLNQQLDFLFVSSELQWKVSTLIELFLYATAFLLPLRSAFLVYFERDIAFSEVSLAAYTLIVVVIILFFFNKEDVVKLLSGQTPIVVWFKKQVEEYYYPVFGFFMMLLILSNPYIGYSNLAWFLSFAAPASIFLLYGLFAAHFLIRKYSVFFFIKEEDDEVIDKFEHAKTYYGLFVALTFIALALSALVILVRLWGVEGYTLGALWHSLSEEWVLRISPTENVGFVELIKLTAFVATGFFISTLMNRFILSKVFEIFRTEPGTQNTISKILHYAIIIITVILGLTAIKLSQYALVASGLLMVGVGFGLQDQIGDYFAGVLILLERPIEIGHFIETMDGHRGRVHKISVRSTTIKTARNFFITVPNRDIVSKPISNWGQGRYPVGAEITVLVSFDSDPEMVREVFLAIVKQHPMILRVPAPIVRFEGFEASALSFFCRAFVSARRVTDMWELASDLRFSIIKTFREKEIVIPYPRQVVYMGPTSTQEGGVKNPVEVKFEHKE